MTNNMAVKKTTKKEGLGLDFGLETIKPIQEKAVRDIELDFSNVDELLNNFSILDVVLKKSEITSAKFNKDREEKIQDGFASMHKISGLATELNINPLLLLLGKFWEHKKYRETIKDMIAKEADKLGYHTADYVQNVLGKQIEAWHDIACSIDRLLFVKTYYKPRPPKGDKKPKVLPPKTQRVQIGNVVYDVPIIKFNEAKLLPIYTDDKEAFKKLVISFSTKVEDEIFEL